MFKSINGPISFLILVVLLKSVSTFNCFLSSITKLLSSTCCSLKVFLAIMTGLSKRQVQRILKSNNIEPLNPGQKPLFYDLNEFEKYYFIAKNTFREQQVEDNSFVIEERKQLKVETLFNNTTNIKKEIGPLIDLNIIYDKNSFISEFRGREESENQQFAVRVG
jgi:hypothetical protein